MKLGIVFVAQPKILTPCAPAASLPIPSFLVLTFLPGVFVEIMRLVRGGGLLSEKMMDGNIQWLSVSRL